MNTLEREVIEKFHQLDKDAQQRVRELIFQNTDLVEQTDTATFDYDAWWSEVDALRGEIRASHGDKLPVVDVVGILREIRDGEDE